MKKTKLTWWAVLVWLLIWQLASAAIHKEILLVSPWRVLERLWQLAQQRFFWLSVAKTLGQISTGFLLATAAGILLAVLAACCKPVEQLLAPLMITVKTVPVASFIILALIWFSSKNLSVLISFLMVLPIIYSHVLDGICEMDPGMLEMARVFRIPWWKKLRYLYLPQILPFFRSGCTLAIGLSWKSGVAAEVIGMPRGTIGEHLQQAKVYLDTPDLFCWTVVIVLLSVILEKTATALLRLTTKLSERM